jgi:hypothetical protein
MPQQTTVQIAIYQRAGSWRYRITIDEDRVLHGDLGVEDGVPEEAALAAARAIIPADKPDRVTVVRIADPPAGDRMGPKRRIEVPLDAGNRERAQR